MGKSRRKNPAVFIDRDGTLIHERNYLCRVSDIRLYARAVEALKLLKEAGYVLVMVTNQSGIGRGYFTEKKLLQVHDALGRMLKKKGVGFDAMYYCPHHPEADCACRKPRLGMVHAARKKIGIDLSRSFSIGDHAGDYLLGRNMGGTGIFVLTGHGAHEREKFASRPDRPLPDRIEKNLYTAARWIVRQGEKINGTSNT